jgi:DNA modification methylase
MGSGTTAIAAKLLNRNFIGIEISPDYIELSKKRLTEALKKPRLF